jgi:TetR/AcrR family transcriptional regulator, ethionamide resistance regulator
VRSYPDIARHGKIANAMAKLNILHYCFCVMTKRKNAPAPPPLRLATATLNRKERKNAVQRTPAAPTTKRGIATRERLKTAAILVLERQGYRNMRLQDVAEEAGINFSLFYHYFASKADLTHEVLTEFIEANIAVETKGLMLHDPFASINAANEVVANLYAKSPGLMRCLVHFDEEENRFSNILRTVSLNWHKKIAISMHKHFPDIPADESTLLMVAYALGGMMDHFLYERFVDCNPMLVDAFPDASSAAHFLTIMWYRAVYLKNPKAEQLGKFASLKFLSYSQKK